MMLCDGPDVKEHKQVKRNLWTGRINVSGHFCARSISSKKKTYPQNSLRIPTRHKSFMRLVTSLHGRRQAPSKFLSSEEKRSVLLRFLFLLPATALFYQCR